MGSRLVYIVAFPHLPILKSIAETIAATKETQPPKEDKTAEGTPMENIETE